MIRRVPLVAWSLLLLAIPDAAAQFGEVPINTFGYFQVIFQHQESSEEERSEYENSDNSFSVQQLNLIFQSDLSERWRAFLDFEMLNNFSSSRRWGSFDLNEAWISYRASGQLTLKAGLHVPVFNHLNDIKNRTPLLPYVIRPLVYEESFREFIDVEDFIPERAFVQVKGFWPVGRAKIDYAAFVGNSPNIRSQFDTFQPGQDGQTGVDTSRTVLVGGRLGLRYGEAVLGGSVTRETENGFTALEDPLDLSRGRLGGVPKTRLGADLSFLLGKWSFEGEVIAVRHDVDAPAELQPAAGRRRPRIGLERTFYYGTIGHHVNERLFAYASYWFADQVFRAQAADYEDLEDLDIEVPTIGLRYSVLQDDVGFDRVTLKAQYAYARIDFRVRDTGGDDPSASFVDIEGKERIHFFALGISVLF